ncbi:ceramidase [Bacteriovoracaceae bacterium]|nr:ceramidase [Bacteriovoracaceae bacterium]
MIKNLYHNLPMEDFKLPPNHPWYTLSSIAPPNVKWCEEILHGWITEPANTWSNLITIIVGIYIFYDLHRQNYKDPFLRLFSPATILLGIGSFIYHMSYNFFTQLLDFYGMYLIFLLPLLFNFRRLNCIKEINLYSYYQFLVYFLSALVVYFYLRDIPFQMIAGSLVALTLFTEWKIFKLKKEKDRIKYKNFIIAASFLFIAAIFSGLDVTRIFCDPKNHFIQGHAIWHVLISLSILYIYKFYAQFEKKYSYEEYKRK